MGFVLKKAWTAPLPKGAEVAEVNGKRIARWRIRGGKLRTAEVLTGEDGSVRIRGQTAAYVARYRNADGVWTEVPTGCKDESSARAVLVKLERRVERIRSGLITADEDVAMRHGDEAIGDHLEAWERHLELKGASPRWISQTIERNRRVAEERGIRKLRDLTSVEVERWLAEAARAGLSAGTRNGYRRSLVTFMNWCVRSGRATANPLRHVATADDRADCRRRRRALTESELERLLDAARRRPLADALMMRRGKRVGELEAKVAPEIRDRLDTLGRERALLYKTLVLTGLRKGELGSITVGQVLLGKDSPRLVLNARDEKNRQGSEIPLRADLADDIAMWLADRLTRLRERAGATGAAIPAALPSTTKLFDVPTGLIRIFDRDLVFAGLARIEERDGKQVVVKTDERGRTIDIHALRHTFGTHLSRGGVSLRTAQAAMRHSDPSLTANVYTDPKMLDVAGALDALPRLSLDLGAKPMTKAKRSGDDGAAA